VSEWTTCACACLYTQAACDHIRQNVIQGACLSNEDLLFLFSRYKVAVGATIGPKYVLGAFVNVTYNGHADVCAFFS
jgi:hypothetical protein